MAEEPQVGMQPVEAEEAEMAAAEPEPAPPVLEQTIDAYVGDRVQINGSGFAVGGGLYDWGLTLPDGKVGDLTNSNMPSPSFVPSEPGDYVLHLSTLDGPATVTVHVAARSTMPLDTSAQQGEVHFAGEDQTVHMGDTVQLDGSRAQTTSYLWELTIRPVNSNASLNDAQTATPWFVPDVIGEYHVTLLLDSGSTDEVTIHAQ